MDKASRPVRNRRHNCRQSWLPGEIQHQNRLQKRLFTPEIKRMLKDWLVRQRENPYPSRDEKKRLAINTGLTYIQICNWFANWRRKLKNVGREPARKTWGNLIKNYNTSANGNVEQFSICSGDSIWEDDDRNTFTEVTNNQHSIGNDQHHTKPNTSEYIPNIYPQPYLIKYCDQFGVSNKCNGSPLENGSVMSHSAANHSNFLHNNVPMEQCFQISSTTQSWNIYNNISYNHNNLITSPTISTTLPPAAPQSLTTKGKLLSKVKYKNNIMEKYLRDCKPSIIEPTTITESNQNYYSSSGSDNEPTGSIQSDNLRLGEITQVMGGIELSKWLESTANFTPNKNNYIEWDYATSNKANQEKDHYSDCPPTETVLNHEREDLEAAEVLTSLAGNYRTRMFGSGGIFVNHS